MIVIGPNKLGFTYWGKRNYWDGEWEPFRAHWHAIIVQANPLEALKMYANYGVVIKMQICSSFTLQKCVKVLHPQLIYCLRMYQIKFKNILLKNISVLLIIFSKGKPLPYPPPFRILASQKIQTVYTWS